MLDTQANPDPQSESSVEGIFIKFPGADKTKELVSGFDSLRQFRLEVASTFFDKISGIISSGTALYEKLIILNGATIALSITFLGSLSSRLASTHKGEHPRLWMVGVSWCFLIVSIYCCYQVILNRHAATSRLLTKVSAEYTAYLYQRLGLEITKWSGLFSGTITVGEERYDIKTARSLC